VLEGFNSLLTTSFFANLGFWWSGTLGPVSRG